MTHRVKRPLPQWVLVPNGEMCLTIGVSSDTLKSWRVQGLLPRGIYWTTLPNSDRILWVKDLVRSWIVNGDNSPSHQKAIERYLKSLPSSDDYQPLAA
jgi:hypothetical protein